MIAIAWANEILTIANPRLGEAPISLRYLKAFCQDGSTNRAWEETVIPHRTELLSSSLNAIQLRSALGNDIVTDHQIVTNENEISFEINLHNPTTIASWAH